MLHSQKEGENVQADRLDLCQGYLQTDFAGKDFRTLLSRWSRANPGIVDTITGVHEVTLSLVLLARLMSARAGDQKGCPFGSDASFISAFVIHSHDAGETIYRSFTIARKVLEMGRDWTSACRAWAAQTNCKSCKGRMRLSICFVCLCLPFAYGGQGLLLGMSFKKV